MMSLHVFFQVSVLDASVRAYFAAQGFLSRVSVPVCNHFLPLDEPLFAYVTLKPPLSCMSHHMVFVVLQPGEHFIAQIALMCLFACAGGACVTSFVHLLVILSHEPFVAVFAYERPLTLVSMYEHVPIKNTP